MRFQEGAVEALQDTVEASLIQLFEEAQLAGLYAKCLTVMAKDIHLAMCMHGWDKDILPTYEPDEYSS